MKVIWNERNYNFVRGKFLCTNTVKGVGSSRCHINSLSNNKPLFDSLVYIAASP